MMNEIVQYLRKRRSLKVKHLLAPGPNEAQLRDILEIGMRVPDHGKLMPWRIKILHPEGQQALGEICADLFAKEMGKDATEAMIRFERERFSRAPLVLAILYTPIMGKIPPWEQQLSCGAVCMNLMHAAHAHGFAAQWLTEWPAFRPEVLYALDGELEDKIAGFIYIGTPGEVPEDRARPDIEDIANVWKKEQNTG